MATTLNFDILLQSIDKLSHQYEQNLAEATNDQLSFKRASALFEGLKGMFGMDDMTITGAGSLLCITVIIDEYRLELFVDPADDLKLQSVQVPADQQSNSIHWSCFYSTLFWQAKRGNDVIDTSDVMEKCSCLAQPNDIRQALYFLREKIDQAQ